MTVMSPGNKKIKARKVPATKKEFLIRTGSLIQPALFKEIPGTNYKILVRTGTGTLDSLKIETQKEKLVETDRNIWH